MAEKLDELVRDGVITSEQADMLAGFVVREQAGVWSGSRWTRQRRRAALREHGLVESLDEREPGRAPTDGRAGQQRKRTTD